ncbi:MAG: isoprenylcysteine carboxylmethyltransferase family protein [Gammaproteobacteria bacterium]|nr:isoprenylcysteine carboxylmethyltransferase family protein [Gammaproteobacteria bacterium]
MEAIKNRMLATKLFALGIFGVSLVSHHVYLDDSIIDLVLEGLGYILLGTAAFGRTWASAYIAGKKNQLLVTDGPYSAVRNPLYFFSFLGFLGAGLAFESIVLASLFGMVFFITHWPAILREEQKLIELFGHSYARYRNRVPRFFPNLRLLEHPHSVVLFPAIFSKALLEASLIAFVFLIAHIVEWAHVHSYLPVALRLF